MGRLNGHSRFSYHEAGCAGKGHSDPVEIESPTIVQLLEEGKRQEDLPFNRHVKRAARQIEETVKGDEGALHLLNQARLAILGDGTDERVPVTPESFAYALATIEAFTDAFDVSFYAIE